MSPAAWQLQPNALTVLTGAARLPGDPPPPSILLQAKGQLCLRKAPSDSQQAITCPPTPTCQEQGLLSEINTDVLSLLKALCTSHWETQPTVNPLQSRGSENHLPGLCCPPQEPKARSYPRGQERSGARAPLQVGFSSRGQGHPKVPASCTEVRTPLEFQLSPHPGQGLPNPHPTEDRFPCSPGGQRRDPGRPPAR